MQNRGYRCVEMSALTSGRAGRRLRTWAGVMLATCLVGAGAPGMLHAQSARSAEQAAAAVRAPTVAVIPFANISGGALADAWLGSGIAETIITDLQQVGSLSIIGRDAPTDHGRHPRARRRGRRGAVLARGGWVASACPGS